jgi:predicted flap endonuclease-1-like 5' DNA nuclease
VSGAAGAGRAAAALALAALAHGAAPRAPVPAPCGQLRLVAAGALAAVACDGGPGRAPQGAAGLLFGRPLDPNRASARDLEALPGIGPARASAIVHEAAERAFCAPADLERVPGIGPVTRARLAGWLEPAAGACAP